MASLRILFAGALLLAIVFGSPSFAIVSPARPKNINVALQTKWEGTSLLLEAGELLAKLRDDFIWSFIERWPPHPSAPPSDEACLNSILHIGSSILDGPLQPVFHLSLLLRSASPKVVLYRQLAEESLLHHMGIMQEDFHPSCQCDGEQQENECTTSSRVVSEKKPCCWVDVGNQAFYSESELADWLGAFRKPLKEQEVKGTHDLDVELFDFDHIFPYSLSSQPVAILYGSPGVSCFGKLHTMLTEAAKLGFVKYVLRPYFSLECQAEQGSCASMGAGSKVLLGGYGVELALKNMEYKAIDDSDVKKNDAIDEARTDDISQEVRGFIFSRLVERKPHLSDDLLTFRDHLLSSSVSDTMNVWELKDLGYQTAQRILHAAEPLRVMQDVNQNFPNLVSAISRLKLNETIKEEIVSNQRLVNPGKNMLAINGALINLEGLDLYSLIELVLGELSLADVISKLKVPSKYVKALMQIPDPAELASVRVDFRSPYVHYLNNLEEDSMYRRWRSNLQELLMPVFPGQMRYIKKNLFNAVYIVDPATSSGLQVVDIILYYYENNVPMRFGIILMSTSAAKSIADSGGDLPSSGIQKDLSILAGKLFMYVKENHGALAAFQFLSRINEARGGDMESRNDDPVELTHIEEAFFDIIKSRAKSPPEEILLKLEKGSEYEESALQSSLFVYKLGLQEMQPCLLMNGVVHTSTSLEGGVQAMSEELPKIQEGVYFGHINSHTDILEKFMKEKAYFRYNPNIVATSKEDVKYVSLARAVTREQTVLNALIFLHSSGTEDDIKPITHLICVDATSRRGFQLLLQSLRYLMSGSKRGRVGILFNVADVSNFRKESSSFFLVRVIKEALRSPGGTKKVLPFLHSLLSWYAAHNFVREDGRDNMREKIMAFAVSAKLKLDLSETSLFSEESVEECLKLVGEETQFMSKHLGLQPGSNAVITNGKVFVLSSQKGFVAEDFVLLEAVEFDRRVKPVSDIIEGVEWEGIDPDDMTSDFLSSGIMCISSEIALRNRGSDTARFDLLQSGHSAIIQEFENATVHVDAIVDPLSSIGQRLSPFFVLLQSWFKASMRILLNPMNSLADLPLKNFYRFVVPSRHPFNANGSLQPGPSAVFSNMPPTRTLTMNLDVPEPWLVEPVDAIYDLDNIVLEKLGEARTMHAVFELEALMLTGHCHEQNDGPPRGLQLVLGTKLNPHVVDTIVMANLGYWQLKASPGVWTLRLAPGRSSNLYTFHGRGEGEDDGPLTKQVMIKDLRGELLHLEVVKRKGKEDEAVLGADDDGNFQYGEHRGKKGWNQNLLKWATDFLGGSKPALQNSGHSKLVERSGESINIFSIASGHLYERFLKIMMLSVLKNTRRPVKFWFIKNYLSPQFKNFIPHMAKEYGFQYDLVTYKWPTWLHKQTEKQRIIWAYKILFLDVIFPLSLRKVIFVDADQIIRTDMGELYDMDLKGRPLAYTPFCDNNKEMDGYRFWNQGFWKDHLRGRPYHISALYVVDLKKFRQTAAGDNLRVFYETLSKDPGSLSNLDQDLPNYAQHQVPIFSLPQEWLWCESWCGNATKAKAKTIDLCNNPMTKEPKLHGARRIVAEWPALDEEARALTSRVLGVSEQADVTVGKSGEEEANVRVEKGAEPADTKIGMESEQSRYVSSNLETASEL
ncbi:hypothetical protein L7F22_030259 [Adiantum nelumboides]|nr:hypothetical protein [Adiantum nelumboides]